MGSPDPNFYHTTSTHHSNHYHYHQVWDLSLRSLTKTALNVSRSAFSPRGGCRELPKWEVGILHCSLGGGYIAKGLALVSF